jgi:DNA-binding LacI/PurR family transcriptional regulator
MATIKQVAERAGVSVATVSYVLNDTHKVRPATERRVLLAAKELGYSPNSAARSLVMGRSSLVGLIVPDLSNPFFPEITKAFQDSASLAGMETIVINTDYDVQRTRSTVNRLLSLQVPGAAFLTSQVEPSVRGALAEKGICAVYLDHGVAGPHTSNVAIDYSHGICEAVEYLLQLGHKRIGFIGGHVHGVSARQRKVAFLDRITGLSGIDVEVIDSDFSVQGGYFACSRLLNGFDATAIMAANDLMAIGALHCAYDRQIAVPAKLSIVGFDDITFAQFTQPALTTIAAPREEIGRLAFQSLSALITSPNQPGGEYAVKTALVKRQTTGLAPACSMAAHGERSL